MQFQFVDLVADAQEIFLRPRQLPLRLLLPVTVAGDARRFLKDAPALGALGGQDLINLALADDGITLPSQAGVHEQLVDVPEAAGTAVDIVLAVPTAVEPAGDHDLLLLQREAMLSVVQHQGHLGVAHGLALLGAGEDHVLHLAAPQGLSGLLPHDPADGVGDIRFSAPVGADHRGDGLVEGETGLVWEGLEALQL